MTNPILPQGVEAGFGVFNMVNVRLTDASGSVYLLGLDNSPKNNNQIFLKLRYCDIPGGYSTYVASDTSWNERSAGFTGDVLSCAMRGNLYYCAANFTLNNYSTNKATHGISQYPKGYAPVPQASPTGRLLRVGPWREYQTLEAAYDAAQNGDDIVIDPGSYNLTAAFHHGARAFTKCVRLWGATENPNDVRLYHDGSTYYGSHFMHWVLDNMVAVPTDLRGPGLFHVWVDRPGSDTWEVSVCVRNRPWTPAVPPAPVQTRNLVGKIARRPVFFGEAGSGAAWSPELQYQSPPALFGSGVATL